MSTRANIKFEAGDEIIHIDRSHDGFPDVILPDLEAAIELSKGRWSGSELGQFVSTFLGLYFDKTNRIQHYEPCIGWTLAGDESYTYFVKWDAVAKVYECGVVDGWEDEA